MHWKHYKFLFYFAFSVSFSFLISFSHLVFLSLIAPCYVGCLSVIIFTVHPLVSYRIQLECDAFAYRESIKLSTSLPVSSSFSQ